LCYNDLTITWVTDRSPTLNFRQERRTPARQRYTYILIYIYTQRYIYTHIYTHRLRARSHAHTIHTHLCKHDVWQSHTQNRQNACPSSDYTIVFFVVFLFFLFRKKLKCRHSGWCQRLDQSSVQHYINNNNRTTTTGQRSSLRHAMHNSVSASTNQSRRSTLECQPIRNTTRVWHAHWPCLARMLAGLKPEETHDWDPCTHTHTHTLHWTWFTITEASRPH